MSESLFDGQREDESVEFVFRRHILVARKGILFLIVMGLIGYLPIIMWPNDTRMFWIWLGFIVIGLLGMAYVYMLWYFSFYIVTDQRIRQVAQKGVFRKTVTDLDLDKIQSISCDIPGIRAGIFNYGTILIQTGVGDLIISSVPKPEKINNDLQNIIRKEFNEKPEES